MKHVKCHKKKTIEKRLERVEKLVDLLVEMNENRTQQEIQELNERLKNICPPFLWGPSDINMMNTKTKGDNHG